ncbi:MAG: 3-hydroxybutyryl-CoA dehydrogenase [Alphaproteobacteria bacterium]|jgi:3-hydroxybutyryl-CoA dehydrogenase|nr:3-hydroxybutyryl-CoA dehydrogenase [Alphaproteobacteria bacterium]
MTRIVAVGAGRMGRGIAQVFAFAGYAITLLDLKPRPAEAAARLLREARDEVTENLDFMASLNLFDGALKPAILGRIEGVAAGEAEAALTAAEIIFECVPETIEAKREALQRIGRLAPAEAIVASTTSSMLSDELAAFVSRPQRFLNAHWLNPAYLIPLVEVSPAAGTSGETTERVMALLEGIGKVPVKCTASPGYIVPRIQAVAMNEACRMVEEGVATPEDIDRAIRARFGIRYATMGLVEFVDWGGVDILYHASNYLKEALGDERFQPPKTVAERMDRGELGLKTGSGFYDFEKIDVAAYRRRKMGDFVALLRHLELLPEPGEEKA